MPFQKGHPRFNKIVWNKGKKTGLIPKTAFKKGQHPSPTTEFKKGNIPWSKGKGNPKIRRENNPNWKGGIMQKWGYIYTYHPNHPNSKYGYVAEHRFVMEKKIGRYLHTWEIVHHLNEIKIDNRIENLKLLKNRSKHLKLHYHLKAQSMYNKQRRYS